MSTPPDPSHPEDAPATASVPLRPVAGRGAELRRRGDLLGRYLILDRVGEGGMGVVYAAFDPELDRKVAVKVLRAKAADGEGRTRLLREAQAMARLAHPHVLTVHDVGTVGGEVFIAMELVEGSNLKAWLAERRRSVQEIVEVMTAAGRGLAAAHAAGLVHRDFKPANVLVGRDGRVRVADFGLVRSAATGELEPAAAPSGEPLAKEATPLASPVTQPGAVMGTPAYMAPEQRRGAPVDARSDQFAFCITLYEALWGERPAAPLPAPPKAAAAGKVSERLRRAVVRGLAADPSARFERMEDLLAELTEDSGRRLRRLAAVGALAALAASALLATGWAVWERSQVCRGAEQRLAEVWDPPAKARVRRAFLASKAPFAPAAWTASEKLLERYAAGWVSMRTEACEATRRRGEQSAEVLDLRMICLDRRLDHLRALTELFRQADRQVVETAVSSASALPAVADCADVAALLAPDAPPREPAARRKLAELQALLARSRTLRDAGKHQAALPLATTILAGAEKLGYQPFLAEVRYHLGSVHDDAGDFATAEKDMLSGVVAAEAGGDVRTKARLACDLMELYARRRVDRERGGFWAQLASAAVDRVGTDDTVLQAGFFTKRGNAKRYYGESASAVADLRRAVALWTKAYGPDHFFVGASLNSLGNALADRGEYAEAQASLERAQSIFRRQLGAEHPNLAKVLTNLGTVAKNRGELAAAQRHLAEALRIQRKLLGPDHPEVFLILYNLANVLQEKEQYAAAQEIYERVLAFDEKQFGPAHPNVAEDLSGIANCLANRGRLAEAAVYHERSLAIAEKALGRDHPSVAMTLFNLAGLAAEQREHERALGLYRRAAAAAEKAMGPEHLYVAQDLAGVGRSLFELGRPGEAVAPLDRALAVFTAHSGTAEDLGRTRFALARALWDTGRDRVRAVELARAAARDLTAAGPELSRHLREVEAWLAAREPSPPP